MDYTIAISGKGGTGKTLFTALTIRWLLKNRRGHSVLAVDGDPNVNLDGALGIKSENSIVAIVDEIGRNPSQIPQGITKDRYLEYQIQESLVESEGFDLLVMGRPEGPGCYCFANNLLRTLIEKLSKSYTYVVIDNEAGMEHFSRRTARKMDLLFIISDYTVVGLRSAKRILDLTKELELGVENARLIINKVPERLNQLNPAPLEKSFLTGPVRNKSPKATVLPKTGISHRINEEIDNIGIPLAGVIPEDEEVFRLGLESGNVSSLSEDSKVVKAVDKICEEVLSGN